MIKNKVELNEYMEADKIVHLSGKEDTFFLYFGLSRRFYRALRRCEYYSNCGKGIVSRILCLYWKMVYRRIGRKMGWDIPINTLGKGTRIMHPGTVVVNGNARIGDYCKIHVCVNIGASKGNKKAPIIGNSVYIGPGAKIFGDIIIADNVAIGANAVVNHSFTEPSVTIAGIPAKEISKKGYHYIPEENVEIWEM